MKSTCRCCYRTPDNLVLWESWGKNVHEIVVYLHDGGRGELYNVQYPPRAHDKRRRDAIRTQSPYLHCILKCVKHHKTCPIPHMRRMLGTKSLCSWTNISTKTGGVCLTHFRTQRVLKANLENGINKIFESANYGLSIDAIKSCWKQLRELIISETIHCTINYYS